MSTDKHNLIWIDLEMTGLNVDQDHIIEIATLVTDTNLNIIAEGPVMAISQPREMLDGMDAWNTRQHNGSGLVQRVIDSTIDEKKAETETLHFLEQFVPVGASPMCGNSICQDRRFLHRYMPTLETYFHYRNLDVSTLKILAQRWAPTTAGAHKKESQHLALADIHDSIDELRFYRENFLQA